MNVRKLALEAIEKIISNKAYSNIVVNEYLNKFEFSKEDKALFTNIVYGTIQYYLSLEYYLEPFIGHKKQKSWVKHLLLLSVYQILYLRIPEYAVLNEAVEIAGMRDQYIGKFVNAVLRNFLRNDLRTLDGLDDIKKLSIQYSHPAWLVSFFLKDYDRETVEEILKENSRIKKEAIRVNTLKATKEEVILRLQEDEIAYEESSLVENGLTIFAPISKHELFLKGLITIQDISAQLVSEITAPTSDSIVIDLCSAPGGKTAHLAALMHNTGKIYACDVHPHKITLMENAFRRLGVKNVLTQLLDAKLTKDYVKEMSADYVLADVPCSGLGVISHKVDIKYQIDLNSIDEILHLQEEIVENTYNLVKVNGYYVYSTCTINKDENERQIERFLSTHPEFEKVEERTILPHEFHTDGFYICKMRRIRT